MDQNKKKRGAHERKAVARMLKTVIAQIRYENAVLHPPPGWTVTAPDGTVLGQWNSNITEMIQESSRIYVETWTTPALEALRKEAAGEELDLWEKRILREGEV